MKCTHVWRATLQLGCYSSVLAKKQVPRATVFSQHKLHMLLEDCTPDIRKLHVMWAACENRFHKQAFHVTSGHYTLVNFLLCSSPIKNTFLKGCDIFCDTTCQS
jgi:hypothetical protein